MPIVQKGTTGWIRGIQKAIVPKEHSTRAGIMEGGLEIYEKGLAKLKM